MMKRIRRSPVTRLITRTGPWTRLFAAATIAFTAVWAEGLVTVRNVAIFSGGVLVLWLLWHWFSPWHPFGERHTITDNRPKMMRRRLYWRLRPDYKHSSMRGLWRHWGRMAMRRSAAYIRPTLTRWYLLWHVAAYSVWLGHAQFGYKIRVPLNQHIVIIAPPQTGKTELLASIILRYPGPVLNTSSKPDVFRRTSGIRAVLGHVDVLNPQCLGGATTEEDEPLDVPSTMAWNLIHGCDNRTVAIRRADAFINGTSFKDVENGSIWKGIAQDCMHALFHAAGIIEHGNLNNVVEWALGHTGTQLAESILRQNGAHQMARQLAIGLHGPDEKANGSVRKILSTCLDFMTDPLLARAVLPADGVGFDPDTFLSGRNTLYMIADTHDDESPLASLFACIANEIHYIAVRKADRQGGKLRNPFLMALDEIAQIVPVPVQVWMADSGGRNIQIVVVAHGEAQLRDRWDEAGARRIMDAATVKIFLPKGSDPATLGMISKLCGTGYYWTPESGDHKSKEPVMDDDMIREMPASRGLIVREDLPLVIAKLVSVRRDPLYVRAERDGLLIADLTPVRTMSAIEAAGGRTELPVASQSGVTPGDVPAIEPADPGAEVAIPGIIADGLPKRAWDDPAFRPSRKGARS